MITVDGFAIDIATSIKPTFKAKATAHPVEKGSVTSDTLIDEPDGLMIEGVVSDAPSGQMVRIRQSEIGLPSQNAFAKFLAIKKDKKIITVVTEHRTYDNMVLLEFSPTFTKDTGEALRFSLTFQVMTVVENDRQFVDVATPLGASKNQRGNKAVKKPPDAPADAKADRNSSVLWKLTH